jgi:isopentenyl diphosphate isomerase/L-lactate dehydrogenase-like FMN-dependent dehydrogenase
MRAVRPSFVTGRCAISSPGWKWCKRVPERRPAQQEDDAYRYTRDVAPAPAEVLPQIADAVGQHLDILADSGVRRGSDVLKYVGLGARTVMIGRLPLWGLAANGEAGADALLAMLRDEIDLTLTMLGLRQPCECRAAILPR